jgi:putative SOS response-associated peptidase YedK
MCGRYRLSRRKQLVEEYFDTASDAEDWNPRFNIAPTQPIPVIRQNPKEPVRHFSLMRWGLIPSWAKDSSAAASMINARSETAATKPAFRDALKSRRCLIPAEGFTLGKTTGFEAAPCDDGDCLDARGIEAEFRAKPVADAKASELN